MLDRTAETVQAINLAHVAPFRLGALDVHPATRQLLHDGRSETLEPRVMQVLIALAQAQGGVVTRDELTDLCWDGRIVSENSINRVISRLRQVAAELGGDSFEIETITKVGYRLRVGGQACAAEPKAHVSSPHRVRSFLARRDLLSAGAVLSLCALGGGAWCWRERADAVPAAARTYLNRAMAARDGGSDAHLQEAIAYLREATRLAPEWAPAWGGLALAYSEIGARLDRPDAGAFAERARSASTRALQLDPGQAEARVARLHLIPVHRGWLAVERGWRDLLRDHPQHPRARSGLGGILSEVGRNEDALPFLEPLAQPDQFNPLVRYRYIYALWAADRVEEAEGALDSAWARWPKHGAIWTARIKFLAHTGRPEAALALLQDPLARPQDYQINDRKNVATIKALISRQSSDVDLAVSLLLEDVITQPFNALTAMQYIAALGRTETALDLAEGHLLGRGPWARSSPPKALASARSTSLLFNPLTRPMRAHPRFSGLVGALGLEAYWQATGSTPDYRRPGAQG